MASLWYLTNPRSKRLPLKNQKSSRRTRMCNKLQVNMLPKLANNKWSNPCRLLRTNQKLARSLRISRHQSLSLLKNTKRSQMLKWKTMVVDLLMRNKLVKIRRQSMKSRKKIRRSLFKKKKRNKTKVMIRLWSHTMKSKRKKKQFHNKNQLKMMNQVSLNNQLSLLRRNRKMSRSRMSHLRKMVLISKSNKIWKRRNL